MNKKISEAEMVAKFQPGAELLTPLIVRSASISEEQDLVTAVRIEARILGEETNVYKFVVAIASRSTPDAIRRASVLAQERVDAVSGNWPMIQVPFLSWKNIEKIESSQERVSAVDLCGNGTITVPNRLYVMRTGAPNLYPDSRPLNNPYRGRSAMVARTLLTRPRCDSLSELVAQMDAAGCDLSLGQASKAVQALQDDLMVSKNKGTIVLTNPMGLLESLGREWRTLKSIPRQFVRVPPGSDWARALSSEVRLKWAITGDASVKRYTTFAQSGPRRVAVTDLKRAVELIGGSVEKVPNFADLELMETEEPGFYMSNETDADGMRWASLLQTWLELQAGDARQQDAAKDLRQRLGKTVQQS